MAARLSAALRAAEARQAISRNLGDSSQRMDPNDSGAAPAGRPALGAPRFGVISNVYSGPGLSENAGVGRAGEPEKLYRARMRARGWEWVQVGVPHRNQFRGPEDAAPASSVRLDRRDAVAGAR